MPGGASSDHEKHCELMNFCRLAQYGGLGPISAHGKPLERVTIAGHRFDLHFGNNGAMKVYSFVAVGDPVYEFSGDVLDFFKHLAAKHRFPMSEQYMLSTPILSDGTSCRLNSQTNSCAVYQFGTEAFTGRDAEFYNPRHEAKVIV